MDPLNLNKTAETVVSGLTGAETVLTANVQQIQTFIGSQVEGIKQEALQVVGESLAALTTERTEALKQIDDMVNGWLDRLAPYGVLPRAKA